MWQAQCWYKGYSGQVKDIGSRGERDSNQLITGRSTLLPAEGSAEGGAQGAGGGLERDEVEGQERLS